MDIADSAEQHEEKSRQIALQQRRKSGPEFTGHCANCGDDVGPMMRWCDADCRDDWERREGR
jgi:hypothetical protein